MTEDGCGVFSTHKSNSKRQKQTLWGKAATIACVHINGTFSLKASIHGLLNSYDIQTNFIRNQKLFILSGRYINSNGTIDKQLSGKKKNQLRVVQRERFPGTNHYRKHKTNATNQNNKEQKSGISQWSALTRVYYENMQFFKLKKVQFLLTMPSTIHALWYCRSPI